MAFESFYGGRMGASFIIVRQFNVIDRDKQGAPQYKSVYYATTVIDNDICYYVDTDNNLIKKSETNFLDYNDWTLTALDGEEVSITNDGINKLSEKKKKDKIETEGMVQCFKKGGATTDQYNGGKGVNYGEYVIIDTDSKDNPDNGKVYRRGMNYTGELGGAEYIGQIVGPRGTTPEVKMNHYVDIAFEVATKVANPKEQGCYEYDANSGQYKESIDETPVSSKTYYYLKKDATNIDYNKVSRDLIPGSYYEDEQLKYNDNITFAYTDFKDAEGNLIGCMIGFKIPYTTLDFEAYSVNPYYYKEKNSSGEIIDRNLISKDTSQYVHGQWEHPFYQKWKVSVPRGIHGVDSKNIEIIHTKSKPAGIDPGYEGTQLYKWNENFTEIVQDTGNIVTESYEVVIDPYEVLLDSSVNIYEKYGSFVKIKYPSNSSRENWTEDIADDRFVKKENCYVDYIRYKEEYYDIYNDSQIINPDSGNPDSGDIKTQIKYHELGSYNSIRKVTLSDDGVLTVFYTNLAEGEIIKNTIRWIDNTYPETCIPADHAWYEKEWDATYNRYYYEKTNDDNPEPGKVYYVLTGDNSIQPTGNPKAQDYYEYIKGDFYFYQRTDDETSQSDKVYYKIGNIREVDVNNQPKGITIDENGTVIVYYNTIKDGERESTRFDNVLDWMTDISLSQEGEFKILFNNNRLRPDGKYTAQLNWIDRIIINENGTIDFYYNSDHEKAKYTSPFRIKVFNKTDPIAIQTKDPNIPGSLEGSGDQKVHITYNTTHVDTTKPDYNPDDPETWIWENDTDVIGEPLNYIIETTIYHTHEVDENHIYNNVDLENHLLVYYSDPVLRTTLDAKIKYPSSKYPGEEWEEWYDLGVLRTDIQGVKILKNATDMDELRDSSGNDLPPEQLREPKRTGQLIDENAKGWAVTLTTINHTTGKPEGKLLIYDYGQHQWEITQEFDSTLLNPKTVIIQLPPVEGTFLPDLTKSEIISLNTGGIWLATQTVKYYGPFETD